MPILRLVDGGVTDNLGVRGSMMSPVAHYGNVADMGSAFTPEQLRRVRHVLVIVANAHVYPSYGWSEEGRAPGLVDTLGGVVRCRLGHPQHNTVLLAKNGFKMWAQGINAERTPSEPKVELDFAVITFNQITDAAERQRFNAMPTTFQLGSEQVDALRIIGRPTVGAITRVPLVLADNAARQALNTRLATQFALALAKAGLDRSAPVDHRGEGLWHKA